MLRGLQAFSAIYHGWLLALGRLGEDVCIQVALGEREAKPGEGAAACRSDGTSLSPAPPPEGQGFSCARVSDE